MAGSDAFGVGLRNLSKLVENTLKENTGKTTNSGNQAGQTSLDGNQAVPTTHSGNQAGQPRLIQPFGGGSPGAGSLPSAADGGSGQ
jgi:hypothetical protein